MLGIDERITAPEVEGLGELRYRGIRIAVVVCLPSEKHQSLEALRVELVRFDAQHVTVRTGG